MKKMNFTPVILCSLMVLGASCTNKLTAKFESDVLDNPPDRTLPGNPSGDVLDYVEALEPQLKVVVTPDSDEDKSLEFRNVPASSDVGPSDKWVSFQAQSTNFAKPVTFIWSGHLDFRSSLAHMLIDITDGSGVMAARLRVENNGDVILIKDFVGENEDNIGNIPNDERHTFMITVDLNRRVYNISVLKRSGNLVKNDNALLASDVLLFHNPAKPTVSFRYEEYHSDLRYIIDEVFINRKN